MQQCDVYGMVRTEFSFSADKLDFDAIDRMMGIAATEIRTSDSFVIEEFAKDYWTLSTGYEKSEGIIIQLEKIFNAISSKKNIIKRICKQYNASCAFLIVVKNCCDYIPPATYERDFVKFAAEINAEINMDFT